MTESNYLPTAASFSAVCYVCWFGRPQQSASRNTEDVSCICLYQSPDTTQNDDGNKPVKLVVCRCSM